MKRNTIPTFKQFVNENYTKRYTHFQNISTDGYAKLYKSLLKNSGISYEEFGLRWYDQTDLVTLFITNSPSIEQNPFENGISNFNLPFSGSGGTTPGLIELKSPSNVTSVGVALNIAYSTLEGEEGEECSISLFFPISKWDIENDIEIDGLHSGSYDDSYTTELRDIEKTETEIIHITYGFDEPMEAIETLMDAKKLQDLIDMVRSKYIS